ncbi:hypothetical protein SEUCBS140593_010401 [Sporothrix eucalyptigena]|uniref:Uncharacterized protein n=1 Tax=Sporothrix eucalyptigena TaxID=1812306 RepID=A0ABP0D4Y1_9PEZI
METTSPLASPTTSIETTAQVSNPSNLSRVLCAKPSQVHAEVAVEENRPAVLPTATNQVRVEAAGEFRDGVNSLYTIFCKMQSWNAALEKKAQELWKYGKDMHDMYTTGQRQNVQLRLVLDVRNKDLAEAEGSLRRTKEELSRCKNCWEQDSRTTDATIKLLQSDCELYKDGSEALAEEIERLTGHVQKLQDKLVGQEGENVELVEQNEALQRELAEARNLLQSIEAPAEPSARTARKKRKL